MAATTTTTALPDAEAARYDRSLRLWGAAAQKLLGSAHVVLLGATSTGCEMLKNLVLPGLGNFTVVDGKAVTRRDLGNNFFLEQSDEGRNRAEAVVPIIAELNPMVRGTPLAAAVPEVIAKGADYLVGELGATLVIASGDVTLSQLTALSKALAGRGVPLVYAACNGMAGAVRIQADPLFILHTVPGPDTKVHDMRAINPFPALEAFFARYDPADTATDHHDFAHTPWFCVIYHALKKWRAGRGADAAPLPANGAEWKEVKAVIESYARIDPVTTLRKLPDSFKDAQENCSVRLDVTRRNTPELNAVLRDPRAAAPSKADELTWFLAYGLRKFRDAHGGVMPHCGAIPDFECTTSMYRELQQVFRAEAAANAVELGAYAREAMAAAGLDPATLDDEAVAEFSKQAWELNYVTYPSIADEFTPGAAAGLSCPINPDAFNGAYTQGFNWYVAHRAGMIYADRHDGVPAGRVATAEAAAAPVDAAANELAAIVKSDVWPDAPIADLRARELAEWARYGGSEIVTVASIVGAVASQECIKLIQKRRRPISHTLVYDGIENCFTTIGAA